MSDTAFGFGMAFPMLRRGAGGEASPFTPDALFIGGQSYGWAIVAPDTVWADTAGTVPGVVDQTIRRLDDQRGAPWIGATTGPTYRVTGGINWLEFGQVAGRELVVTVPAITNGTLMIAHKNAGVMSGNVTIPAGTYSVGRYDSHGIVGMLLIDRNLSQPEREQVRQWFITERGAGDFSAATDFWDYARGQRLTSFDPPDTSNGTNFTAFLFDNQLTTIPLFDTSSGVNFVNFLQVNQLTTVPLFDTANGTNFQGFLLGNQLTTVPLFDTSSGTNFRAFLYNNQLTTIPLFDTSSGTNFQNFLAINTGLADIPVGLFDDVKGTNFITAFLNCALTQQSVDNVLVSVATAAAANNLNNGTFTGLDSGTNSAPSATGIAAKNALIARGWTVTTF